MGGQGVSVRLERHIIKFNLEILRSILFTAGCIHYILLRFIYILRAMTKSNLFFVIVWREGMYKRHVAVRMPLIQHKFLRFRLDLAVLAMEKRCVVRVPS